MLNRINEEINKYEYANQLNEEINKYEYANQINEETNKYEYAQSNKRGNKLVRICSIEKNRK